MTDAEVQARIDRQERDLAALTSRMSSLAARHPSAVVLAMLDALIAAVAGRPEFVPTMRIRVYRAVIANLASKGLS